MPKTIDKSNRVLQALSCKEDIETIKNRESKDQDDWGRISKKAYEIYLKSEQERRMDDSKKKHVLCTSVDEINDLVKLNEQLLNYALCIPTTVTNDDIKTIKKLIKIMPASENDLLHCFSNFIMGPRMRALQKKGRFDVLKPFVDFSLIIDSAVLSYYRENYIAAYLTLIPVIEGVISRWMGYFGQGEKPSFEDMRKFFRNCHMRQPRPGNALFYDLFSKACDKLLKEHFYKPSTSGDSYSNFNRHVAAHFLNNSFFATKENTVRLFLLLDLMTEIYIYETYAKDKRFELKGTDIELEYSLYSNMILGAKIVSPEKVLLSK